MAIDSMQDMAIPPLQLNWRGLLAERGYQVAVLLFCLIHLSLLLYDTSHPSAFLVADRGEKRLAKIEAFAEAVHNGDSLGKLFVATGSPGDYLFHAFFYLWGGRQGVAVAQLVAGLVGITYLYLLAHRLTGSSLAATMATILYILLPASVQYPHVLLTEGFFNPLVIACVYYLVRYLQDEEHPVVHLLASGFLLSVATLLREVILPIAGLVLLVLLLLALRGRIRWGHLVAYAAASLVLPLVLMSFFYGGERSQCGFQPGWPDCTYQPYGKDQSTAHSGR